MQTSEQRVKQLGALGFCELNLDAFPTARIQQMAAHVSIIKLGHLTALQKTRRLASLLAFARVHELVAVDNLLDLFSVLMSGLISKSERQAGQKRLAELAKLDGTALLLALVCEVLVDGACGDNETVQPIAITIDMSSVSNAVFALFWFQGYEFQPRSVDMDNKRFWRSDPMTDYTNALGQGD